MGQTVALDRVAQRLHHCILPDQFGKGLRPVFARQDAVSCAARYCRLWLRRHIQPKAQRVVGHIRIALGKIGIIGIGHRHHVRPAAIRKSKA